MTTKKTPNSPQPTPAEQAAGATARFDAEQVNEPSQRAPDPVPLDELRATAEKDGKARQKLDDEDKYGQPLAPTEASTVRLESTPSTAVIPPATPVVVDGSLPPPPPEDIAVVQPAPPMGFPAPVQDERNALEQSGLRAAIAEKNRPDEAEELKK